MKKVELVFKKDFKKMLSVPNPGVNAANHFWPIVAKYLDNEKPVRSLSEDKVLKEHFTTGHAAASTLKDACKQASSIKVVHHMDSRSLPTITIFFILNQLSFYELTVSFNVATGKPLLVTRSEKTEVLAAAA